MSILELLSRDNFLMTNISLAKALGLHGAVLIGELARKYNYWLTNNGLTEDGYFFITQQEIEEDTTLSPYKQAVTFKQLEEKGIISIAQKGGTQRTNYYRLNEDSISNFLSFHTQKTSVSKVKKLGTTKTRNTKTENTKTVYEIVDYLNSKTGSRFKATTPQTARLINARLKEGYTESDFYTVIDNKVKDWLNDAKMSEYLRPQTLFGNKFEGYLNQKPKQSEYERFMNDLQQMYDEEVRHGE